MARILRNKATLNKRFFLSKSGFKIYKLRVVMVRFTVKLFTGVTKPPEKLVNTFLSAYLLLSTVQVQL